MTKKIAMLKFLNDKLKFLNLNRLEKFFFALFLLSIPLQTRLTFITPQTYLFGQFNEYATFFIYLSDIFIITTFLLCFVNILTKHNKISINLKTFSTSPHIIPILFFLFLWMLATSFFAEYKNIAFYQNFKLFEYILLSIYVAKRLSWFGLTRFASLIFITGVFQSIIGIVQYIDQKSLGLKILGEPDLSPKIDNIAKIFISGERFIRAYGTFPHPNVFAAFLILSITLSFWLILFAKTKQNTKIVSRETILDGARKGKKNWISILTIGTLLQFTALILTFSRIAWLGLTLSFIFIILIIIKLMFQKQNAKIVSRETILASAKEGETILNSIILNIKHFWSNTLSIIQKKSFITISIGLILIIAIFWTQINNRTINPENSYQQATTYRNLYNNISIKIINDHPLIGIGNGNFTLKMKNYSLVSLEWWQYQPAHNIYLLIASESGIIGLIIFLFLIFTIIKKAYLKQNNQNVSRFSAIATADKNTNQIKQDDQIVSRETISASAKEGETFSTSKKINKTYWLNNFILAVFISFLIMALLDHYLWTLQQGRLIFWLTIGILLSFQNQSFLSSKIVSRETILE